MNEHSQPETKCPVRDYQKPIERLSCSVVYLIILAASVAALAGAYTAEYAYGLAPCILCIYQRIPFVICLTIALVGLRFAKTAFAPFGILAAGIVFEINALIAIYHSGVERKWWPSFLEGCAVPDLGDDPDKILETIMNAPAARCDEIPWQDPFIGLSMANYNAAYCLWLASLCIACFILIRRRQAQT
jgi:disulfide bond formation protein DsbB